MGRFSCIRACVFRVVFDGSTREKVVGMLYKKKVFYGGMEFDSSGERDRYLDLSGMQNRGEISGLRRQVRFELLPRQVKVVRVRLKTREKLVEKFLEHDVSYTCDFVYMECGVYVVEDVKSWFTRGADEGYPIRRKLMVRKMQEHNRRGHGQWVFREYVLGSGRKPGKVIDR